MKVLQEEQGTTGKQKRRSKVQQCLKQFTDEVILFGRKYGRNLKKICFRNDFGTYYGKGMLGYRCCYFFLILSG